MNANSRVNQQIRLFGLAVRLLTLAMFLTWGGLAPALAQTAPAVLSVSPSHGPIAGGTTVTITGTDFTDATSVTFGSVDVTTGFTVNAAGTEITVPSPPGSAGTVRVSVTTPNGTSADAGADDFVYALPIAASVSLAPTTIPADNSTVSVVTYVITNVNPTVSLTGIRYTLNLPAGLGYVSGTASINPGSATGVSGTVGGSLFTVNVATLPPSTSVVLQFSVRSSLVGSYTITGNTTTSSAGPGTGATAPTPITVTEIAPSITGLAPSVGGTGGGTVVAITGDRFLTASGVTFGGVPATSFTVVSQTRINATAPAGTAGVVRVAVTNAADTTADTMADDFTYLTPPTLAAAFAPTSIPADGTTAATLTLTLSNPNTVDLTGVGISSSALPAGLFGSSPATTCSSGTASLSSGAVSLSGATVAANSNCTVTLNIASTTPGTYTYTSGQPTGAFGTGSSTTTPTGLSVLALPAVTSISPSSGPLAGGTAVTITGTDFTGATRVSFGSVDVPATSFTSISDTQIVVPSPAGSAGTVRVSVTTARGTSPDAAQDDFTYVAAPTLTSFTFGTVVPYNTGAASPVTIDVATGASAANAPTSYAVVSGTTLFGGTLSIDNAGVASYTPPVGFRTIDTFLVNATNAGGTSANITVSVIVGDPVFVASVPVATGEVGVAFSQQVSITGGAAPYADFSATGLPDGLIISPSGLISGTPTVSGTFAAVVITATDSSGGASFTGVAAPITLTIGQGAQTITFTPPSAQTFAPGGTVSLTASATSGLEVAFASITPDVCTVSGTTATIVSAGTCTIEASQPGDSNYDPAPVVTESFSIGQASQTITFTPPATQEFSTGGTVTVSATATSGLEVTFASTTPGVCTVSGTTVSFVTVGTCSVTASQSGDINYAAAPDVSGSFTIAPGAQTITFPDPSQTSFFIGTQITVTATASSGLTVQFSTLTPDICLVSTTGVVAFLATGDCIVAADQPGNTTVAAAPQVTKTLTVGGVDPAVEVELLSKMQTARARALILNQPDLIALLADKVTGAASLSVSSTGTDFDLARMGGPIWARLSGSVTEQDGGTRDHYVQLSFGSHIAAGPDTILGLMATVDSIRLTDPTGRVDGEGWLIGPYFVSRLGTQALAFEVRALAGRTEDSVAQTGLPASTTDGTRSLLMARLSGSYAVNDSLTLMPTMSVAAVKQASGAYLAAGGTPVPGVETDYRQASLGLNFRHVTSYSGGTVTLTGGLGWFMSETGADNQGDGLNYSLGIAQTFGAFSGMELGLMGQRDFANDADTVGLSFKFESRF